MTRPNTKTKSKYRPRHNPNITHSARILGVTREHLSRVLNGRRESRSLTRRFTDLQASATQEAAQ